LRQFASTWEDGRVWIWPSVVSKRRVDSRANAPAAVWKYQSFAKSLARVVSERRKLSTAPESPVWQYGPAEWRRTFGTFLALSGINSSTNALLAGKKAFKGAPAVPHRYLRSYLEQQFKSW
jgi:hypothetical protein